MFAGWPDMNEGGLDLLTANRSRTTPQTNIFYGRVARGLRVVLAFGILATIVIIFLWPELDSSAPSVAKQAPPDIASNELVKPRFEAIDPDQQPYTITADRAIQNTQDSDLIDMIKPVADITLKDGTWLSLEADRGAYRQAAGTMNLTGHVRLFQDEGYELRGTKVAIDMKAGRVISDEAVEGQGPAGTLVATGMDASQNTGILIFNGPAVLTLNQSVLQ
jgi:lipopolysaccharide export system protein LptC